jgi:hypothetical protein
LIPRSNNPFAANGVRRISRNIPYKNLEGEMAVSSDDPKGTPAALLRVLFEKFDAKDQKLIRSVRSAVRKRLPTANELVYDYKTFFVIGYSPTDQPTDGIVSIAARPDGVRLYLMQGPQLSDPKKLLMGSGKQTRFIRVEAARQLAHPDVEALIAAAIDRARVPLATDGRGELVIRTFAGKQLRRRQAK